MNEAVSQLANRGMLVEPGDHFKGEFEVERKFRVDQLEMVRTSLSALNATAFTLGNVETDIFFDLPDGRLAANNQSQSLRQMLPSGRVLWISKGPEPDQCVAMDLADYDKAMAMLLSLGFVETMRVKKKRDIYFIENFHVTLDDVSHLGTFVELAVMTDNREELIALNSEVHEMAKKLGLLDYAEETRSYREMLAG